MKINNVAYVMNALLLVSFSHLANGGGVSCDVNDDFAMTPEAKCAAFKSYVDTRHLVQELGERPNDAKAAVCEAFEHLSPFACPSDHFVDKICAAPSIADMDEALKERYCEPWLRVCDLGDDEDKCVRRCVRYVSDCCGVSCK